MIRAVLLVLALGVAWATAPTGDYQSPNLPEPIPVSAPASLDTAPAAPASLSA